MDDIITIRRLARKDWRLYRDMRLAALKNDPAVFCETHEEEAAKTEAEWRDMLSDRENGYLGMFDGRKMIGLAAIINNGGEFVWEKLFTNPGEIVRELFNAVSALGIVSAFSHAANNLNGSAAWLGEIYLDPQYRGRGLAKRLYEEGVKWATTQLNLTELMATVRESNGASNKLIQKSGFRELFRGACAWPDGKTENGIIYRLDLEQQRIEPKI